MKKVSKKIVSSLFILLGFAPLLVLFVFTIKQQSIRHRMKEKMEKQALQNITLAENEIHWAKEGKEIWVQGKMFDIKSTVHKNGMTTFQGLFDDDETSLVNNFNTDWKKKMAEKNQLLGQFFQYLQGVYFMPANNSPFLSTKQLYSISLNSPKIQSQFKTILTPPPQV